MKASLVKAGAVDPDVVVRDGISELNEVLAREFDGAGGRAGENGTVFEKHVATMNSSACRWLPTQLGGSRRPREPPAIAGPVIE